MKLVYGNIFNRAIRGGVTLSPFELRALELCVQALPADMAKIILEQIEQFNLVQREVDWRALNFYRIRGFRKVCDVRPLLSLKSEDVPLVKVVFSTQNGETINAVIHVFKGRLFSINFGASTKPIKDITELEIIKVTKSWLSAI